MPKIRFTDTSTGIKADADSDLPIDATPYGGSAATVRPKVYRIAAASPSILPPENLQRPVIVGAPTVASNLSLAGFNWDGATSFGFRWLADGVLVGTGETYAVGTGDQGKTITAEMQGIGIATSGWVSATNVLFIPIVALAVVNPDEWSTYEAPADADTRKTFMRIDDTPSAGFEFGFWRSSTPVPDDVTLTTLGAFAYVTDHYEATSSGRNPIGTPSARSTQYVRIAERNIAAPTNTALWRWVSETKTYLSSSTPGVPVVSVSQGTAVGEIIINITTVADPSDRAVTRYEYRVDGVGSWITLGGGLGIGPKSITGFTPLQSYSIEVRAVNANGNGIATAASTTLAGDPPVLPPPVTTLVFGSQQFTLDGAYTVITHIDGPKCIVSASPVTILSKSPAVITTVGGLRHGAMKNPQRAYQAFDDRCTQTDRTKLVTFPLALSTGDILLSAVSSAEGAVISARDGNVDSYDMVYVAASAPNPLSLAPAAIGWPGRGTPAAGPVIDFDTAAAAMPTTYGVAGYSYSTDAQIDRAVRFNPILGLTYKSSTSAPDAGYERLFPTRWGTPIAKDPTAGGSNYGQFVNGRVADLMWQIFAATADVPLARKAKIMMRVCSFAWQTVQAWDGNNTTSVSTGDGHYQMHQGPFALLYHLTSNTAALDALRTVHPGFWNVFFFFTEDAIPEWFTPWGDPDNTSSMFTLSYPAQTFRRKILAVDAVAKTVTIPSLTGYGAGGSYGGSSKAKWTGLILTKESNPATNAKITGPTSDWPNGSVATYTLTLDTWPGFAVNDVVTAQPPWTPVVGDAEWRLSQRPNQYCASAFHSYRDQSDSLPYLAFLWVLGLHRVDWQAAWQYALRCDNANDPVAGNDYPICYESSRHFGAIWAAHKATILAIPQPNLP